MNDNDLRIKHENSLLYEKHGLHNIHRDPALIKARSELQPQALDLLDDMTLITSPIWAFGQDWADFDTAVKYFDYPEGRRANTDKFGNNLTKILASPKFSAHTVFVTNLILDFKRKRSGDKKNAMSVTLKPRVFLDYAREFALPRIELHKPKVVIAMGMSVTNALLKADGQPGIKGSFNSFVNRVAQQEAPRLTNGAHLIPVFHPGHFGWVVSRKCAKGVTKDAQNIADWSVALRYV
jgi:hypothetical protein